MHKFFLTLFSLSSMLTVVQTRAQAPGALSETTPGLQAVSPAGEIYRQGSVSIPIHFRIGNASLAPSYRKNDMSCCLLDSLLTGKKPGVECVDSIDLAGRTSPEGSFAINSRLAIQRAETVRNYLRQTFPVVCDVPIDIAGLCDEQDLSHALHEAVTSDVQVPCRETALMLLDDQDYTLAEKLENLRLLPGGAYRYMSTDLFPQMRKAVVQIYYSEKQKPMSMQLSALAASGQVCDTVAGASTPAPVALTPGQSVRKPFLAIKTNLLFDALTALNLEVEVPIGKRWSVAGELIFPWWLNDKKQNCFQLINGTVEGRYWFGDRTNRLQMTGWFAGLYAGGGYYDLERHSKGYQGEFFIAAGISGGYTHTINRRGNLRMEYSLGVGYMQTKYRSYEAGLDDDGDWRLYRETTGRYSWFGPTRLKVSLVWMLDLKKKGGVK